MDVVSVVFAQGRGDGGEVFEQREHLVVGRIVWDEEAQVGIVQDSCDPNQAGPATGYDADVFPRVLRGLALAVEVIVEVCYRCSEGFDAGCRAVFAASQADGNGSGSLKASFNVVVDFGCTLAKIGP